MYNIHATSSLSLSLSPQKTPLILPLKTSFISSGQLVKPPNKLSFHHNVSLTVSLTVGSPPQQVTMVLDTGSELSWLHCKKTANTPLTFNSFSSKSYTSIPCSSPPLVGPEPGISLRPFHATRKSFATLLFPTLMPPPWKAISLPTLFRFGNSGMPRTVFGCMDSGFSSNPEDSRTAGLLGMNRGSLSFVTQMGFPKFSYCISGQDASDVLLFGEATFPWLRPLNYTPMVQISTPLPYFNRVAYTVQLEGIKVAGKVLALPKPVYVPDHTGAGQTMVDSGTQFTFLLGPVYNALKMEFLRQTKGLLPVFEDPNFVFQEAMDLCYRVDLTRKALPVLSTVGLMFRGVEMSVSGEKLLYRVPVNEEGEMKYIALLLEIPNC